MSNAKLVQALAALKEWQHREDERGENRHGRCLEAIRYAVGTVDLRLPPPQGRPNNTALWNGHKLLDNPAAYGWRRVSPADDRYTLEYFDHVGRLDDGRIAGHVGIVDHQARIIYSSTDYPLSDGWQRNRIGSLLPAQAAPADALAGHDENGVAHALQDVNALVAGEENP